MVLALTFIFCTHSAELLPKVSKKVCFWWWPAIEHYIMHNATIMRLSSCAPNEFRRAAYHYFWIKDDGINLQAFPSRRTNVVINTQQSRSFKLPYMDVECRQRGRRLEGWSKTAASLGGWRKVARQVLFCTWWTSRTACLFRTVLVVLTRPDGIPAAAIKSLPKRPSPATNVKKQQQGLFWKCLFSFSHECAYRKERE